MSEARLQTSLNHATRQQGPQTAFLLAGAALTLAASLSLHSADPVDNKPPQTPPKPADNSYCLVCHANYKNEDLARTHQQAGIGCAKCHGESDRHSADEDGLTPPEIMFASDKINPACIKCHPLEKLAQAPEHAPILEKKPAKLKTCTECHGKHRLAVRTRQWDKNTGKLISDDGVRMMQTNSPARNAR